MVRCEGAVLRFSYCTSCVHAHIAYLGSQSVDSVLLRAAVLSIPGTPHSAHPNKLFLAF